MSVGIEKRLEWMEKRLAAKHKTYSVQAIKRLAATLIHVEDVDCEHEDEHDYERRIEREKILDEQHELEEKQRLDVTDEVKPEYKKAQKRRIEKLTTDPLLRKLFNGRKPANTKPTVFKGINKKDRLGRTALHRAAYNNNLDECKKLVEEKKINIKIEDNRNHTAYAIAVREGYTEIANYLLSKQKC